MKIIIIGGTGFLGYYAGKEFLRRGHSITALGLPPLPMDQDYLDQVKVITLNLETTSDDQLLEALSGYDSLVYASGLDDRSTPKKPSYPAFYHHNIETTTRVLRLAKQAGIKCAVVLGSYFSYFAREWKELKLAEKHPYIRSRIEQEKAVFALSSSDFQTMILELPYIFGGMQGRNPLWKPLIDMTRTGFVFFFKGGTNCISVQSVAEAIVGAVEQGKGGEAYLIGDENFTWDQMFQGFARALEKRIWIITLPTFVLRIALFFIYFKHWIEGKQSGLDPLHLHQIETAITFFDPTPSQQALGYSRGNLEQAFKDTVDSCN